MSRDIIDAFERRLRSDFNDIPKLTQDEKIKLRDSLKDKISEIQKDMDRELVNSKKNHTSQYKNLALSQMVLLYFYDQINYGKL